MKKEECNCVDECTCGEDCNCTEENRCSPNCTCPEDKLKKQSHCSCEPNCNCNGDEKCDENCDCNDHCDCGDECDCGDDCDEHCDCHEHDCDCDDHYDCGDEMHPKNSEEAFAMYEKAFRQLEDALIKADKEIGKEKARADENEHIARAYKQDLERFKTRHQNAEEECKIKANCDTAIKLLPLLDNFETAFASVTDKNITKGFEMIYNNLKEVISNLGVEEIETLNQVFNPEMHDCISKVKAPKKNKSGLVSRVFKNGYKIKGENGKILRHSVVEIYE